MERPISWSGAYNDIDVCATKLRAHLPKTGFETKGAQQRSEMHPGDEGNAVSVHPWHIPCVRLLWYC